jgi:hypothetical protein
MSQDKAVVPGPMIVLLERVTAAVLVLVLLVLGWMIAAANWPERFSWASTEVEVIAVLGLLSAALALVSVVALLHTRR